MNSKKYLIKTELGKSEREKDSKVPSIKRSLSGRGLTVASRLENKSSGPGHESLASATENSKNKLKDFISPIVVKHSRTKCNGDSSSAPNTPMMAQTSSIKTQRHAYREVLGESKINSLNTRSQRYRVSVEGDSYTGGSPISSSISVTMATAGRKSTGATPKSGTSNFRRSSSARKSFSKSLLVSACKNNAANSNSNTPINKTPRQMFHSPYITPTMQLEVNSLRKLDVPSLSQNFVDMEANDESSKVTVGVRVRPLNERELRSLNVRNIVKMEGNDLVIHCENDSVHMFSYDQCMWSCDASHPNYSSQEQVYNGMARPLLTHAFEGYNVCLFAYGQTSSGKSYSIMGEDKNGYLCNDDGIVSPSVGVIPRFCLELFNKTDSIHSKKDVKCSITTEISYIEIYNEKIFDLVGGSSSTFLNTEDIRVIGSNAFEEKREPLKIREHPQHGPYVVGASSHVVSSYQDLQTWINLGNKQRSVAATGMNDKSSRSHSVFTIKLSQTHTETVADEEMEHCRVSVINLVDLAGSERVAAAYSEGDRLKEGICINKSLLTLGKVIMALAESGERRKSFIPYRESTLTWLLKESLGGNSKTTMIATISPSNIHQEETLSTLRYAQQARKIVNWNHVNEDPTYKIIRALKLEVERLRSLQLSPKSLFGDEMKGEEENDEEDKGDNEIENEEITKQQLEEREIIEEKENEIKLLKEKLKVTQEQFLQRTKLWKSKLIESEKKKKEALGICKMRGLALKLENNKPTLVNLCEDPQLSQTLLYNLKKGSTSFGASETDVTLTGLNQAGVHCSILFEGDKLYLYPINYTETYVNGKLVTSETEIFHNDRIVFGGVYFFRVCYSNGSGGESVSSDEEKGNMFDFIYARDELLKEQEERIRREMKEQQDVARSEILREVEEKRLEMKLHEKSMRENLEFLAEELREERNINQESEMARAFLEDQKNYLEDQVNAFKGLNSQSSLDSSCVTPSPTDLNTFFKEVEGMFDETINAAKGEDPTLATEDVDIWFKITKVNDMCVSLKKPYHFEQQSVLSTKGYELKILVHDLDHDFYAFLTTTQFKDIFTILADLTSGEQEDESMLSFITSIHWERLNELSKIQILNDKIKENANRNSLLNSSCFNASFNASSLNLSLMPSTVAASRRISLRRDSLNRSFARIASSSESVVPARSGLAKVLAQSLLDRHFPSRQITPFNEAVVNFIHLSSSIQNLSSQYPQPDDEKISLLLTNIAMLSHTAETSVMRVSSLALPHPHAKCDDVIELQNKMAADGRNIVKKVIRILQGVEKDVESLVDVECSSILELVSDCVLKVGFLNTIANTDYIRGSSLCSSTNVCRSYLSGVSDGLEWLVKNVAKFSEQSSGVLSSQVEGSRSPMILDKVSKSAFEAIHQMALFLKLFSELKVVPNIDEDISTDALRNEANRFVSRVGAAAGNIQELFMALTEVTQKVKDMDRGMERIDTLEDEIVRWQEAMGELVNDANIGSSFNKNNRLDSTSTADSIDLFMEDLHHAAMKTFRRIKIFKSSVSLFSNSSGLKRRMDSPLNIICCSFTQEASSVPLKSSFKHGLHSHDQKRVRFDVSLSPSLSTTFLDDSVCD